MWFKNRNNCQEQYLFHCKVYIIVTTIQVSLITKINWKTFDTVLLPQVRRYISDVARIFSITVTNAVDGVSSSCRACALSSQASSSACVPCSPGHYIDTVTSKCLECPSNSYLVPHTTSGSDACKACGPGSRSDKVCKQSRFMDQAVFYSRMLEGETHRKNCVCAFQDHRLCYSDCHFTHTEGNVTLTFDFSLLGSAGTLMNGPKFTSKGTKYFHMFNISLCGGQVSTEKHPHARVNKTKNKKSFKGFCAQMESLCHFLSI